MKKKNKILLTCLVAVISLSCLFAFAACGEKETKAEFTPETFAETRVYELDTQNTKIMNDPLISLVAFGFIDKQNSYFEFGADGRVRGQIKTTTLDIDSILASLSSFNVTKDSIGAMLKNIDLGSGLNTMAEPMFPGFARHIAEGDLEGAMKLVEDSLGLNLQGFDYSDPKLTAALKKMGDEYKNSNGTNLHLPEDLLDLIPQQLAIVADWQYNIVRQTGNDGTTRDAIFIGGETAHSAMTQSFAVFSMSKDKNGKETLSLRIEFLNTTISLKLREKK